MESLILISFAALFGSLLTLYSGFGLGTLLLPVFSLFFEIETAVFLTAIVHFLNNLFKLFLLGKAASWKHVIRFGLPSIPAAFLGALLLHYINTDEALFSYYLGEQEIQIFSIKLIIGILILGFTLVEFLPGLRNYTFGEKWLATGGIISGFFGGLSGHQGALRTMFLLKSGLSKESFIATGIVIGCLIDFTRISTYLGQAWPAIEAKFIIIPCLCAFLGAFLGNKLLKKMTIDAVQKVIAILLIIFSLFMISGII
jgi:uncharacterized membrane protein YfcA